MEPAKQNYVYFAVFELGDDPSIVSTIMGIEPTRAWTRGQPIATSSGNGRHTHSRWQLNSRLPLDAEVEAHVVDVLEQLEPLSRQLEEVTRRFTAHHGIATYGGNKGFLLNSTLLGRIAALKVAVDIQFYS